MKCNVITAIGLSGALKFVRHQMKEQGATDELLARERDIVKRMLAFEMTIPDRGIIRSTGEIAVESILNETDEESMQRAFGVSDTPENVAKITRIQEEIRRLHAEGQSLNSLEDLLDVPISPETADFLFGGKPPGRSQA